MNEDERKEIMTIEWEAGETVRLLSHYLNERVLSKGDCESLDWIRGHISAVCHELFHDLFHEQYQLTLTERSFFLNKAGMYLFGRSIPTLWTLDSIRQGILCPFTTDTDIETLINYLEDIKRMCRISEREGVLPKKESWDATQ